MRKVFHPSSPHAVGNFSSNLAMSAHLGELGQNFGFHALLTDIESRPMQPEKERFDSVKERPVVNPGINVNDSFEVALFLLALMFLFCVFIFGCFVLSWTQDHQKSGQMPVRPTQQTPQTYFYSERQTFHY